MIFLRVALKTVQGQLSLGFVFEWILGEMKSFAGCLVVTKWVTSRMVGVFASLLIL